ncbi:Ank2, partial [Symbiodinium natans]
VTTNAGDVQTLKSRSFLVRFFAGFWSNFLERYKLYVIVCFVLSTLVSLVGIATTLSVDGSPPVIFPESHNQILGRKIFDRFETAVAVSASPAQEQSYICDIGVQPLRARADTSVACGTFTSTGWCTSEDKKDVMSGACSNTCGLTGACFATWCPVEDAPNVTKQEPGRCDCYQETSAEVGVRPAQAPPGIVRFETSVVGFSKESWMSLEPHLRGLYLSLAGPPGSGFSQTSSYRPALDE